MTMMSSALRTPDKADGRSEFARTVLAGLSATPKKLSPKYLYDAAGSRLFQRITEQPEYYPTRTEMGILQDKAAEIAGLIPPGAVLVEFGMGSADKVRILLRAAPQLAAYVPVDIAGLIPPGAVLVEFGMGSADKVRILLKAAPQLAAYVPVDIAAEALHSEAEALARDFPQLAVLPVAADFTQPFDLPAAVREKPRVGFFPGSTIGNFEPHEATRFLQRAGDVLGAGSMLIVGVDLEKDPKVLDAAYDDAAGVTAAFNLNLLTRLNRELGADFRPERFEHHAFYNRDLHRVEMHLASCERQTVRIAGQTVGFRAGESIHTESSYKYSVESFSAVARGAGWKPLKVWTDADGYFSVHALSRAPADPKPGGT